MEEWGLLLLLGVFGFVMQFCLTAGLAYAGPESASGIKSAQLVVKDDVEDAVALGEGEEDEPSKSPSSSSSSSSGTRATSMLYTQMLFALFFDKLIWGLSPTGSSWVGSGIILACAIWVAAARDMQVRDNNKGVDAERGRKTAPHDDEEQQGLMNYNPFSPAAEAAESSEGNGMEQENANAESGRRTSS